MPKIEKATTKHLPEIIALMNAGAASVRKGKEYLDWQAYLPTFEAMQNAPEVDIYVAVDEDGAVVGTCQIHTLRGLAYKGRPRIEVESVHVRADLRGSGIGRLMMNHAGQVAKAMGACMIQLTSNKEREGSHHFYRKLGYDQSHLGYKKMFV